MSYDITWKDNAAIWRYYGDLDGPETIQSHMEVYGDERFDDLIYKIVDSRAIETTSISTEDIKQIAYLDMAAAKTNPRIQMAVIVTSEVSMKMVQEYASHAKDLSWSMQLFDSMEAVEDWIASQSD